MYKIAWKTSRRSEGELLFFFLADYINPRTATFPKNYL